jgi:acetyl-CoA carboxylase biotin carboxyl carrier protein
MNLKQIKAVLRLLDASDVTEFEYEDDGLRLTIRRGAVAQAAAAVATLSPAPMAAAPALVPAVAADVVVPASTALKVTSPFVGTFYRSTAPDVDPFTGQGERVEVGQTLCIVEAMKLMNEIEADTAGVVTRVLVNDGEPVEFGQELFEIEPD